MADKSVFPTETTARLFFRFKYCALSQVFNFFSGFILFFQEKTFYGNFYR